MDAPAINSNTQIFNLFAVVRTRVWLKNNFVQMKYGCISGGIRRKNQRNWSYRVSARHYVTEMYELLSGLILSCSGMFFFYVLGKRLKRFNSPPRSVDLKFWSDREIPFL